ncbi:MAG TPA: hypothetical protein VH595_01050 [Verrucomicrobiae bacterium]|jgi:hypothetical protein|nr:hypothetical protein [Verrucomicrobiae bacterium]
MIRWCIVLLLAGLHCLNAATASDSTPDLWNLAQRFGDDHRFSTLFTAQDVRDSLSSDAAIDGAIQWCKESGVTKVYLEEFRDGYQTDRATLARARDRFRAKGFLVSGCVTTTRVGKPSDHWSSEISCYTDAATQDHLESIFKYAAGLFDEIMIDDFWFTDCTCSNCDAARRAQAVIVGSHSYPIVGDTWSDYRRELMLRVSEDRLLAAAKSINPKVRLIIKYPQWYDKFQDRGYDVTRETAAFDRIWVGTETRDYTNAEWGHTPQYEGYFLMRWLGGIGGEKCGGGWYDWLGTTERTYVEQARQTILAGARESMLFHFGGLHYDTGLPDIEALRKNIPELLTVAREVQRRKPLGIAAYKPANSSPRDEARVFDFVGMIGLPLVPCHEFPTNAPAAFLSAHALADTNLTQELEGFIKTGRPIILTDGLVRRLENRINLRATNVYVLTVNGDPKSLLALPQQRLDEIRAPLLNPFRAKFRAPNGVALYLFTHGGWVVENFNDSAVDVTLNGHPVHVDARGWSYRWN